MAVYALVMDGTVTNMIVWDGIVEVDFAGEPIPTGDGAGIGATWDGNVFTPPVESEERPSDLQLLVEKLVEKKVITKEDAGTIGIEISVDAQVDIEGHI